MINPPISVTFCIFGNIDIMWNFWNYILINLLTTCFGNINDKNINLYIILPWFSKHHSIHTIEANVVFCSERMSMDSRCSLSIRIIAIPPFFCTYNLIEYLEHHYFKCLFLIRTRGIFTISFNKNDCSINIIFNSFTGCNWLRDANLSK